MNTSILRHLMACSQDLICTFDITGRFIQVSESLSQLLGYKREEIEGKLVQNFYYAAPYNETVPDFPLLKASSSAIQLKNCYSNKSGQAVSLIWSVVWSKEENLFFGIAHNTTGEIPASEGIVNSREFQDLIGMYGSDMLALLDENGAYLYVAGAHLRDMGYEAKQLIGRDVFQIIHPEDLPEALDTFALIKHSPEPIKISNYRIKTVDGKWRWIEATASNQLHNPTIKAIFISAQDITKRKEAELKLEQSEQRFRSLFENHPDMIVFQDDAGTILDANPSFLTFTNTPKEEVLNRPLHDFLPAENVKLFWQKRQEAFLGKKISFEIDLNLPKVGSRVLSVTKVPLLIAGKVAGIHNISKDITEIALANRTIQEHAHKVDAILESITDAFYALDKNWNFTYINSEFERLLAKDRRQLMGMNIWNSFPEEITRKLYPFYQQVIETRTKVNFEVYLGTFQKWFDVSAYPSEEGLSVYFHDISDKVASQKELEKLSLVASKVTKGVLITDANGKTEWLNEAFTQMTGYTLTELIGQIPGDLLRGPNTDQNEQVAFEKNLQQGIPFNSVLLNYKKTGEAFWASIDITPVLNDTGTITQYIGIHKDITFRKEAETNLLHMSQELWEQNRDLQQFAYIISHNLRSPVANALGFAKLLTRVKKESPQFDTSLAYLQECISRLDEVLKDINQILSIRDKKQTLKKEKIRVAEVCWQVVADLADLLQQSKGQVLVEVPEETWVEANPAYLYSIFYNLLTNAIKYRSPERFLQVTIRAFFPPEGGIVLTILDNGSGFNVQKAGDNVFKMYKRFHQSQDGKGLGLFLVKTQVETMGGRIEVESQVGIGTRFTIYLK